MKNPLIIFLILVLIISLGYVGEWVVSQPIMSSYDPTAIHWASTHAAGDILYNDASVNNPGSWKVLNKGTAGQFLNMNAGATAPQWSTFTLGTHSSGDYVKSITNGSGITGGDGGSEGAALTITATLGTDITGSEIRDADYGDFTFLSGSATLNNDVVGGDEILDADYGDFTFSGGSATIDSDVINDTHIDWGTGANQVSIADLSGNQISPAVVWDMGSSTSFELPQGAAPTTNATGEVALDTTITDHQPLWQYYDGGENMTLIAIDTTQLPAQDNEAIIYDAASDKFVLEAQAGAAGGDAWSDPVDAHIIPTGADDTYDVGSSTAQFRNGYFDGTLEADVLTEGGNDVYNSSETPGGELGGTWASPTIDDDVLDFTEFVDSMTMDTPTTIAMANNSLTMNFTTPSDGLTLNSTGAFTNHLLHLHQSAGNPGAGTALAHLSYVDVDIIPIFSDHVGVQASAIIQKYQLNKSNNDTSDNDEIYNSWYFDQDGTVSAQGEIEFIRTTYVATDTSEDTEDAQIEWDLMSNGTLTQRMVLNNAGQLQMDGGITTAGTVEGATLTEGGQAVWNASETDILDSGHYIADSIDNEHINWADIDYLGNEGAGVDEAYAAGWNADVGPPEKDDVYDYLVQFDADADGSFTDESWLTGWTGSASITTLGTDSVSDNEIDYSNVTLADFDYQGNWKTFYSDGSGDVQELANGTSTWVFTSQGTGTAPAWAEATGGGGTAWDDIGDPDAAATVDFVTYTQTIDIGVTDTGGPKSGLILDVTGLGAGSTDVVALEITTAAATNEADYVPMEVRVDSGTTNALVFAIDYEGEVFTDGGIRLENNGWIRQVSGDTIDFTEGADTFSMFFNGTDIGLIWSDGVLNLRNNEDGVDAIVEIEGKDGGEKGILRVRSDGDDKYVEMHHDDTDGHFISQQGALILRNNADGIDAIINVRASDATQKGIFRVLSAGNDKYIELYHDDTDAIINVNSGVLKTATLTVTQVFYAASSTTTLPSRVANQDRHLIFNVFNPSGVQSDDTQVCIWPETDANLTVTKITVTLDAAGNEVAGDLKYADTFIGLANPVVINVFDTTSGVLEDSSITSGSVAAGKAIYIQFDSAPNAAITQMCIDVVYDYD